MKYIVITSVFLIGFLFPNLTFACSPLWYDDTGQYFMNLASATNTAIIEDFFYDSSETQDFFNTWLEYANQVSGEVFSVTVSFASGWHALDVNMGPCDLDALGCTEWVEHGTTGRISRFIVHMDENADWVTYSKRAVLIHEIGHAVGMWHAYQLQDCGSCGYENLPTMASCTGSGIAVGCGGCGHTVADPWGITLSPADIAEIQLHYLDAVFTNPDDGDEEIIPDPNTAWSLTCYPNPFNPQTEIILESPGYQNEDEKYLLSIFDMKGHQVFTTGGYIEAGNTRLIWNGRTNTGMTLPAGIYTIKVATDRQVVTTKAALLK